MTDYVVVTRDGRIPVKRCFSVTEAGDYIFRERAFDRWTVLAQEGSSIGPGTPYRGLTPYERQQLERSLYPGLYE